MELAMKSASNAVYEIQLHIIFVVKYRRKALSNEMLASLKGVFAKALHAWRCELVELGGEVDHVRMTDKPWRKRRAP